MGHVVHKEGNGCMNVDVHAYIKHGVVRCLRIVGQRREPYAPFLSVDVRSGSKPCCIFNESLTSSVPLSHCLSCQCLLNPDLHGTHGEKREHH